MKMIVKLTLVLGLVAALSAGLLSYVYSITNPIIQEETIRRRNEQLSSIYPDATNFEEVNDGLENYETLNACFQAKKDDNVLGYVYQCQVNGYGGKVTYLIAIDHTGVYKGYEAIDFTTETSGFGSRVGTDEMKDHIVGQKAGSDIDGLSGATITSTAVIGGINDAYHHYQEVFS